MALCLPACHYLHLHNAAPILSSLFPCCPSSKQQSPIDAYHNAYHDSSSSMGVAWNAGADADLFQAVLAFSPPLTQMPAADREGIVAFMHSRGHTDATWEGIR